VRRALLFVAVLFWYLVYALTIPPAPGERLSPYQTPDGPVPAEHQPIDALS
jgi:hypothetical protein